MERLGPLALKRSLLSVFIQFPPNLSYVFLQPCSPHAGALCRSLVHCALHVGEPRPIHVLESITLQAQIPAHSHVPTGLGTQRIILQAQIPNHSHVPKGLGQDAQPIRLVRRWAP